MTAAVQSLKHVIDKLSDSGRYLILDLSEYITKLVDVAVTQHPQ
jgi:hypothetical protein